MGGQCYTTLLAVSDSLHAFSNRNAEKCTMFLSVGACVISRTEYTELLLTGRSLNVREKGKGTGGGVTGRCVCWSISREHFGARARNIQGPRNKLCMWFSLQLQAAIIPAVLRGFLFIRSFLSLWYGLKDDDDHHYVDKGW